MKVFYLCALAILASTGCESDGDAANGSTPPSAGDVGDTAGVDSADSTNNQDATIPFGDLSADNAHETDDGDGNNALWAPVDLVMPGTYVEEGFWQETQVEQKFGIPEVACASGHHFGKFEPLGGLCVDDPHTLSLSNCKDHTNDPPCTGTTASGQAYLCGCDALGVQFGADLKSWCKEFGHPQENCESGGVRVEFTACNEAGCWEDPVVYKKTAK